MLPTLEDRRPRFWGSVRVNALGAIIGGIVAGIVLAALFAPGSFPFTGRSDCAVQHAPNLVDLHAANLDLEDWHIDFTFHKRAGSPGIVFRQEPGAGDAVDCASPLTIMAHVSQHAAMPDLVGRSEEYSVGAVEAFAGKVAREYEHSDRPEGEVIGQTPATGEPIPSIVIIDISAGLAPSQASPSVVDATIAAPTHTG